MRFLCALQLVGVVFDSARLDCARANGTPAAAEACAGVDARLPNVAFRALPPYLFVTAKRYVGGGQRTVERRIPLPCHVGLQGLQIIESRHDLTPCAIGAAGVKLSRAGIGRRLIAMPFFAFPPYLCVRKGGCAVRVELTVFVIVPLGGNLGKERDKISLAGDRLIAHAIWAARAVRGNTVHRRLPAVPLVAFPPYLFLGMNGSVLRAGTLVFLIIPKHENIGALLR